MFCTTCGHKLPSEDLKFCPECGQPIMKDQAIQSTADEGKQPQQTPPVPPVTFTNEEPAPQPPRRPVNKKTRILLTIGLLFVVGLGALYAYFSQQFDVNKQKQAFYDSIFEQNYTMYEYIQLPKDVIYDKDGYLNSIQTELRKIDDLDTHIMESKKERIPLKNEDGHLFGTLTFEPHWGLFKKLVFQPNTITVKLTSVDDDLIFHFGEEDIPLKKGKEQTFKTVLNISVPAKITHDKGLIKEGDFEITLLPQEANEVFEEVFTAEDFKHPLESNNIDATLYYGDTSLEKTIRELDGELLYYTNDDLSDLNAKVHVNGQTYEAKNDAEFEGLFQFEKAATGESNVEPAVSEEALRTFLSSYREDYEQALNFDDPTLISKYFIDGSKLQRDYEQFVRDMHPTSYYDFMQFDITNVETVSPNSFIIHTYEVFDFTEHTGHTIHYKRQKEYDVITKNDELYITDIRIPDTKKNKR